MSEPYLGQIQAFGFQFAPRGWAQCNGRLLDISQFTALFTLLGTTYGGDGTSTFGLPDLRGRMPLHYGTGPGLPPYVWGAKGGSPTVTLSVANLPSHSHTLLCSDEPGNSNVAEGNFCAEDAGFQSATYSTRARSSMNGQSIANTGGGQSFSNMPPFLALNYCIALIGIYPSPNRPTRSK